MNPEEIERSFRHKSERGVVKAQDRTSYEIIEEVMRRGIEKGIIWWFAYELMGFHEIDGERYFLSYKASTRISEMAKDGIVESRATDGKLNLYRLKVESI